MNASYPRTPYPKTCLLIANMGINASRVLLEDLSTAGYYEVLVDGNGRKKFDPVTKQVRRVRREWPSLADGIRVIDQYIKEGGAS